MSSVIGMAVIGEAIESDEEVEVHNTHCKTRSKPGNVQSDTYLLPKLRNFDAEMLFMCRFKS